MAHPDRRIAEAAKFGLEPVLAPGKGAGTLRSALAEALGSARDGEAVMAA